jgi:hypothetical protein
VTACVMPSIVISDRYAIEQPVLSVEVIDGKHLIRLLLLY